MSGTTPGRPAGGSPPRRRSILPPVLVIAGIWFAWSTWQQADDVAAWPALVVLGLAVAAYGGWRTWQERTAERR